MARQHRRVARKPMKRSTSPLHVEQLESRELLSVGPDLFVRHAYQDLLGRSPDPDGAAHWSGLLDQGFSPGQVAQRIQGSLEFHERLIDTQYHQLLHRHADPQGLSVFAASTSDDLRLALIASDEYYLRAGGAPSAFLAQLYRDALGREIDSTGRADFGAALDHTLGRGDIIRAVVGSDEALQVRVNDLYQRLMNRHADPAGFALWSGLLRQGICTEQIVAGVLDSVEYPAVTLQALVSSGGIQPNYYTPPVDGHETPPVDYSDCDCSEGDGELAERDPNSEKKSISQTAGFSGGAVRYYNGGVKLATNDLQSDGFGTRWGMSRSWTNTFSPNSFNGSGMINSQLPFLRQLSSGNQVALVSSGINALYFDKQSNGGFVAEDFMQSTLEHQSAVYLIKNKTGKKFTFNDFTGSDPSAGQVTTFTDQMGNVTTISYTSGGLPSEVQRSETVGSSTVTESYLFTYGTGANASLIVNAKLRRQVDGGSWTTVRQVDYAYYGTLDSNGNQGDLKTAIIKDASDNVLDTKYYRYYTNTTNGYVRGLKFYFSPASFSRLAAAYSDPYSASDSEVAPYADNYFEYDSSKRVTTSIVQGAGCSSCSGGQGTYTYEYTTSSNANGLGYNIWTYKTVETLPDGNTNTVYCNFAGEVMMKIFTSGEQSWIWYTQYDGQGRIILEANPSAMSGYDEGSDDLVVISYGSAYYVNDDTGLLTITEYGTSTSAGTTTAGDAYGYWKDTKLEQGEAGTQILQAEGQYFERTAGGETVYPLANVTAYRNTDGTGDETTSYSYTWFSGTVRKQSVTVTKPVISSSQNGPGSADVETTYFDIDARPIWQKDGDGFLNYTAYDVATGAVSKTIRDVDTSQTSDFSDLPSGWSTPTGGGLHLITQVEVDSLARTTKLTDPKGNVTYTVFLDTNHEMRTYAGWQTSTSTPTGPTYIWREDRNYATGYIETLTMSATPSVSSGRPTGAESIGSLETLSRQYISEGGQVTESDAYFHLSGLTYATSLYLGTSGTNYYETLKDYDDRGRPNRTVNPLGTVTRTVYDGLGRVVSVWIGTNDTPASGEWDPANNTSPSNMIKVSENVYDGGDVGDSNLTQVTQIPGVSAANRVSQFYFDWRNRLVATKLGVETSESTSLNRPLTYREYDNLNEVVADEQYDGDAVAITDANSDGVPDKPSSSLLRARSRGDYDDQGRLYQIQDYSVNQSNGTVSTNSLSTNIWRNHRSKTVKTSQAGGLVIKSLYDGANRLIRTYGTDGGGDSAWSDAGNVTGDAVLAQAEKQYDADGNVILQITKNRFHDETATGELGNASTSPKGRVSYIASYYDAANRVTAQVNLGTNGGSAYTRPSTVPSRTDTVLVVSWDYNSAGWMETTTDPRGIASKTYYDNLARTIKTIEAYADGTPSNGDDKTIEYTYDGANHALTLKASLASGYEKTEWDYGVTTGGGSGVNSNDVLATVRHPDKSSGDPSSSEEEVYKVNALGDWISSTDRNGNVHAYSFDVVGRQASDAVTTLGSGVDGSIRRLETAYDTAGQPYLFTSYDAASSGSVVNQVQRGFNGLEQLTVEYQAHSGAVNTSTTPKVQYAYSEMASGANHSRIVSMTYPNGRELDYNYATGLDTTISRLSSISDSSATLESYAYLGLSTVVKRAHPQPGIDLTYIKQSGESNGDAGDQYTGLDRFGRVVGQRWIKTSDGSATDRFKYGYDRNGNVLYKSNELNHDFDELYHANGASNGYDQLNQLTDFRRGPLSDSNSDGVPDTVTTASTTASWSLDTVGNWSAVTTDGSSQTRSSNRQNQITSISSLTTPTYDANGNMTGDENGNTLVYDAWNRLLAVKQGTTTLVSYTYDAGFRRITENLGAITHLYYSAAWQVIETRDATAARIQYVWSPTYVDALILRDRDADANGSLEERLYAQHDAEWTITGLVDASGNIQERVVTLPYGQFSFLTPTWGSRISSSYSWICVYQAQFYCSTTGQFLVRFRSYTAVLGRWSQTDPLGLLPNEVNAYRYEGNDPTSSVDPLGLYKQDHHWFPVFRGRPVNGQDMVNKICCKEGIELHINHFTTTVEAGKGTPHWYFHDSLHYNDAIESVYAHAKNCCDVITGVIDAIMVTWTMALFEGYDLPPVPHIHPYQTGEGGTSTVDELERLWKRACKKNDKEPKPAPVPVPVNKPPVDIPVWVVVLAGVGYQVYQDLFRKPPVISKPVSGSTPVSPWFFITLPPSMAPELYFPSLFPSTRPELSRG